MSAATDAFDVDLPCPRCGQRLVLGFMLRTAEGAHQHTRYVCRYWPSGAARVACDWSGWTVPGWDSPRASP